MHTGKLRFLVCDLHFIHVTYTFDKIVLYNSLRMQGCNSFVSPKIRGIPSQIQCLILSFNKVCIFHYPYTYIYIYFMYAILAQYEDPV